MSTTTSKRGRRAAIAVRTILLSTLAALALAAQPASAASGWRIQTASNTNVPPGGTLDYKVQLANGSDGSTGETPYTITATLPDGMTWVSAQPAFGMSCPIAAGASVVVCTSAFPMPPLDTNFSTLTAEADAGASGVRTATFEVEGGGVAPAASTVNPVRITAEEPEFGIDAFDSLFSNAAGEAAKTAAAHPAASRVAIEFNTHTDASPHYGPVSPVEDVKDVTVELAPGLVGAGTAAERCSLADLGNTLNIDHSPLCVPESQVGMVKIGFGRPLAGHVPIFNLVPPPDVPARFGFNVFGTVVILDATVRNGDYGISIASRKSGQGLVLSAVETDFWGIPAAPVHTPDRACPGELPPADGGNACASSAPPRALLRTPTSCTATPDTGFATTLRIDSWQDPGDTDERTVLSHEPPGFPYHPEDEDPAMRWGEEVGIEGCESVPFEPAISVEPTTTAADSPSGLSVELSVPQECWEPMATVEEVEAAICQSDLRDAAVTLPAGMSVNPSSASGLGACSEAQVGYIPGSSSPLEFSGGPASCPDSSKIGTVEIETPLLGEPLEGAVFLAEQGNNPFGSLLAMYMVAEGSGVVVKQAGEIEIGPDGRLTTRFTDAPQQPISNLSLELYGGPRAALRTPSTCGVHTAEASLAPWSGNAPVELESSFEITSGPAGPCPTGGFDPKLDAGSSNPVAGAFSSFVLNVSREDGTQELGGISASPPPGLLAKLAGVPYCPEAALASVSGELGTGAAQFASPACPAASQVGTVTAGAGAGSNPFYAETGRVYLAGPYKGAPLSLAVVVPALAGPFDLGSVVVRNALQVDPSTARVTTVSDPLPSVLHGIPLDLREVRVSIDRPNFILNPTSCDPMSVDATLTSLGGASAQRSNRFQVGGCEELGFKPALRISLKGKTRRGGYPKLRAVLTPRAGDANIARTSVVLPPSQFVAQEHLADICTRVQFAAEACPRKSVYGHARAFSPLLDQPLRGPVYLRSNGGARELPDLVAVLDGQIEIEVVGYIDSVHERLRTRFATVPDAPVSRFVLDMKGGPKSLLRNSADLCRGKHRASVQMDGQNGKIRDFASRVRVKCGKGRKTGR